MSPWYKEQNSLTRARRARMSIRKYIGLNIKIFMASRGVMAAVLKSFFFTVLSSNIWTTTNQKTITHNYSSLAQEGGPFSAEFH